ncbi:hypothetical protein VKT23_012853 [Stygiomarasmius scandens]|uniref:Uncharacterized protein n=1 Tax=Marasmiellus scandens TaxID=2682957 RepID=A0ABR1J575_9AGAR
MHLEGYQRRYGDGVASVYVPGKTQTEMIADINKDLHLEIEEKLPAHPCLASVADVRIDLGDTAYGLGTLGRRYVNIIYRFGPGQNDIATSRTYCPGPSIAQAVGVDALSKGVIGELLRIRHGLTNQGGKLVVRNEDIVDGPPGDYPPYFAPRGHSHAPTESFPLNRRFSTSSAFNSPHRMSSRSHVLNTNQSIVTTEVVAKDGSARCKAGRAEPTCVGPTVTTRFFLKVSKN